MIGSPLRNTIRAASGSTQMLNSAAGVQFPARIAPPIRQMCAIFGAISGYVRSSSPMFVSGPTGISVTGSGAAARVARRNSRAPSGRGADHGLGEVGPVEAAHAVDLGGRLERPDERLVGAGGDRNVGPVEQREDPQRVARGVGERRVAPGGRDAEDLELRAGPGRA